MGDFSETFSSGAEMKVKFDLISQFYGDKPEQ
jgi:hypothetical protein